MGVGLASIFWQLDLAQHNNKLGVGSKSVIEPQNF
jgi:hypothetical protein